MFTSLSNLFLPMSPEMRFMKLLSLPKRPAVVGVGVLPLSGSGLAAFSLRLGKTSLPSLAKREGFAGVTGATPGAVLRGDFGSLNTLTAVGFSKVGFVASGNGIGVRGLIGEAGARAVVGTAGT